MRIISALYSTDVKQRSAQRESWREIMHYSSGINLKVPLFFHLAAQVFVLLFYLSLYQYMDKAQCSV